MTREEFKNAAQELYEKFESYAGEEGHQEMDALLWKCLRSLGYGDGLDILSDLEPIWYA